MTESHRRDGRLVAHLVSFSRLLRAAGIPVGPGQEIEALRAIEAVGITRRGDFYWALHAVFVNRGDQRALFEQAFRSFWSDRGQEIGGLPDLASKSRLGEQVGRPAPGSRRVGDALPSGARPRESASEETTLRPEQVGSSPREVLRRKDFEQMSAEEVEEAKRAIDHMRLPLSDHRTRRFRPSGRGGRLDMRRTLGASVRGGGAGIALRWKKPMRRRLPLVALCDISGSMGRYTRMFIRFLHALTNHETQVDTFLFGTRLSHVTRHLRQRDPDEALAALGEAVEDWSGGTRIGDCLGDFNRHWSRRLLARGAVVLLMTDGLDRDEARGLDVQMDRLQRFCRRLIWLNPLLRYEGFEPKALGIRSILPHVDDFRPVHDLGSLEELAATISVIRHPSSVRDRRSG